MFVAVAVTFAGVEGSETAVAVAGACGFEPTAEPVVGDWLTALGVVGACGVELTAEPVVGDWLTALGMAGACGVEPIVEPVVGDWLTASCCSVRSRSNSAFAACTSCVKLASAYFFAWICRATEASPVCRRRFSAVGLEVH